MPTFGKAEIRNLTRVIESGWFCDKQGGYMDKFRDDFARTLKAKHAISGATAMVLMQAIPGAIDAGAGDEIICDPIVQFHGIACLHNNVMPVWADVRPDNFLIDADKVEKKITKRTKAIWVTHLWGFPAEVDKLRRIADKHGICLLEDCAHAMMAKYEGKYLGNWGHIGTFSFNMGKQLATGEGGMAICNDNKLAAELNKRIIFGESPEVLSSNYRMTEFQAAVGVEQLKKVPRYLKTYRAGRKILDEAIADCPWLDVRRELPGSETSPFVWSCIFRSEHRNIDYGIFKAALKQDDTWFGFGFTQRPAYCYSLFRTPEKLGRKGWPFNYEGKINNSDGLCPVAEEIIPRLITANNMVSVSACHRTAKALRKAIKMTERREIEPLTYSRDEEHVLEIVKKYGPVEPSEVIEIFDKKKIGHYNEHKMFMMMEGLRDRFPYKLSHAGPRKFIYHDLS